MFEAVAVFAQENSQGAGVLPLLIALGVIAIGVALYIVPTIVAAARKHRQLKAIVALNVLLGWSFIGWVGALVWALVEPAAPDEYGGSPRA